MENQHKHENQRDFERYPLDFMVNVAGLSQSGTAFSDSGKIQDISGGGLCFSTAHPDWYAVGQKLAVHVCLPGTDELDASMASDGCVIWVHGSGSVKGGSQEMALVGMGLDGCMAFETRRLSQSEDSPA